MASSGMVSLATKLIEQLYPIAAGSWTLKVDTKYLINAVLLDAEKKQQLTFDNELCHWLEKLNEALEDAEDVSDVFNTKDLIYEVESKKKVKYMSQLGTFFSSSNQVLFALSMSPIVRDLTQTFHKLNADKGDFKLIPNIPNELAVMSRRVDHIFFLRRLLLEGRRF